MSSIIRLLYELHRQDANLTSLMNRPAVLWEENNLTYTNNLVHVAVTKKQLGVLLLLIELVMKRNVHSDVVYVSMYVCMYVCIVGCGFERSQ